MLELLRRMLHCTGGRVSKRPTDCGNQFSLSRPMHLLGLVDLHRCLLQPVSRMSNDFTFLPPYDPQGEE